MDDRTYLEQLIMGAGLHKEGRFVPYFYMEYLFEDVDEDLEKGGHRLLNFMRQELKLKPAFVTNGYSIVSLDSPDVLCASRMFSLENREWPKPRKAVGAPFYPLINVAHLNKYFAHSIRWFDHPLRPGTMLPLRLNSYILGQEHPTTRMYVDVPVVFQNSGSLNYIRVSLTVFEIILESQTGIFGRWCQLMKNAGSTTFIDRGAPSKEEHDAMWQHFSTHEEMFEHNKHLAGDDSVGRDAARIVADYLIHSK